jgi:HTH-type transcriptional regulator / antitoxin HipB
MHDRSSDKGLPELAELVRRRREELGLRQAELAEMAGCSARFLHTVEAGKTTVRLDKLADVLRVLGLRLRLELRSAGDAGAANGDEGPRP